MAITWCASLGRAIIFRVVKDCPWNPFGADCSAKKYRSGLGHLVSVSLIKNKSANVGRIECQTADISTRTSGSVII